MVGVAATMGFDVALAGRRPPDATSFTIDPPPVGISRCANVAGSGEVPERWVLWVAVLDPKRYYYFDAPAAVDKDHRRWEVRNVYVGDETREESAV